MTDADWFHARGLTAGQLSEVKAGTLRPFPTIVGAMLKTLSGDYAYPFSSWWGKIQQELYGTWNRYMKDVSFLPWRRN
jgi:hypothetical protein